MTFASTWRGAYTWRMTRRSWGTVRASLTLGVGLVIAGSGCSRCSKPAEGEPTQESRAQNQGAASPVRGTTPSSSEPTLTQRASAFAAKLGKKHFLIGMGNDLNEDHDLDGAYTLGAPMDIHYAYLVGLGGKGGWPDWNPGGTFVDVLAESARKHGVVPMFTLYSMAASGEGTSEVLSDSAYMKAYLDDARLLFRRLGEFDAPAIVHFEPDFWGFMQQKEPDPREHDAEVEPHAPECKGLGNSVAGLGRCLVRLARQNAPKTLVGFHASSWAHTEPKMIANYLEDLGASEADFVGVETLDRDAGCFEARKDPNCQRRDGPWYWDETNQRSPNFHEHLEWARAIASGVRRPLLWWQMPLGVPSDTPGGKPGQYRDNRVKYLFEHVDEFVAAGGVGAVFGVGAANQTYITTDGGQFKRAVEKYRAEPFLFEP